jgi:CubicO group peptidase (beta-lactamase class C family)
MNRLRCAAALLATLCLGAPAIGQTSRLDGYAAALFGRSGLPGLAVVVVHGDRTLYARGFGADGNGGAVSPDTRFILGSTSKSFTALAILQLAEAGRLRLDDPVAQYLPGFLRRAPAARRITLRMLLNQTSGLSHEAGDQPVLDAGETGPAAIRDWALALDTDALNREPGASYEYSNANYVVLGAVVEAASGVNYPAYVYAHIFKPLGMTHTRAVYPGPLAHGHKQVFGVNYVSDLPYPESFVAAGFIITTANDIAKYLSAQLPGSANAGRLGISQASIAVWHKGVAPVDPRSRYAMGWVEGTFNGLPVVWHNGDTGVFSSEFTLDPRARNGVVVLSNGSGWLASDYLQEISSGIINILAGRTPRDDTGIHRLVLAIYLAILAVPAAQILALWLMRRRRHAGLFGRIWPVALHVLAATGLLFALPRGLFGIPFTELLTSFPDLAGAAILSGIAALIAIVEAVFQPRPMATSPRKTASASAV